MTDCDRVSSSLTSGEGLPQALAAHVGACPACRRLAGVDAWMALRAQHRVTLGPALRAAVAADPGPVRLVSPWRRAVVASLVAISAVATAVLFAPLRPEAASSLAFVALTLTAALGLGLVFFRGNDGLGPSRGVREAYLLGAAIVFIWTAVTPAVSDASADSLRARATTRPPGISALVSQGWTEVAPESPRGRSAPLRAGDCGSYGLVLTLLVGATALVGARRTVPLRPEASGACAGVAAGLVAAAALRLHGADGLTHTLIAHGMPVVLGGILGWSVGRRVLPP